MCLKTLKDQCHSQKKNCQEVVELNGKKSAGLGAQSPSKGTGCKEHEQAPLSLTDKEIQGDNCFK